MIEIAQLINVKLDHIRDLVRAEKSNEYEICVPKETKLFFSERKDIIAEYMFAAYSGQLLSNISEKFDYKKITPAVCEDIVFTVTATDQEKLADTILEIAYLYGNEREEDHYDETDAYESVDQFISDVETKTITSVCPYFFKVRKEMLSEMEKEIDGDD